MQESFWRDRWEKNEIAFHERKANPLLVAHFNQLEVPQGGRVFVPLCGKSLDIHWLLAQGYRVAGAELIQLAVEQLFAELGVEPEITPVGPLHRYSAPNIDIFVGDIFGLSCNELGPIDAVYDRGALVAFPEVMRDRYAAHLVELTQHAPQLLITFVYDQSLQAGPPFSIPPEEVARQYQSDFVLTQLASVDVPGGLKRICAATEGVWLIKPRGRV
jgi:thiopurine S-methyltransferase